MMKTIDRYILRAFAVNYLILLVVLTLLINTLDLILNQDEFIKAGRVFAERWGWSVFAATAWAVWDFYWPQVFFYFIYLSGLLGAAAVGFTLAQLQRNRELVAMVAGGISLHRAALPMLLAGAICSALLVIDQEWVIASPPMQRKLSRSHPDMIRGYLKSFPVEFVPDGQGALFCARKFDNRVDAMKEVTILRRNAEGINTERISADEAEWDETNRGWRLLNGTLIVERDPDRPLAQQRVPIAFLPSDLDPTTLRLRQFAKVRQLLSINQLRALMEKERMVNVAELRRMVYSRFSFPVMNLLIMAMTLPFFLKRTPGNLVRQSIPALGVCLGAWGGGFIMLQIGPDNLHPALIAWLPVLLYLPVAFYLMDKLET